MRPSLREGVPQNLRPEISRRKRACRRARRTGIAGPGDGRPSARAALAFVRADGPLIWLLAPRPDSARLATLPAEVQTRAGHLGVLAAIAAFREGRPWLADLLAHLDRNRRLLGALLAAHLPTVGYAPPEASYLAWLDCGGLGLGDDQAAHVLAHGRVALSRGLDFGANGAGFGHLNMGTSRALLEEAVRRMATGGVGSGSAAATPRRHHEP